MSICIPNLDCRKFIVSRLIPVDGECYKSNVKGFVFLKIYDSLIDFDIWNEISARDKWRCVGIPILSFESVVKLS